MPFILVIVFDPDGSKQTVCGDHVTDNFLDLWFHVSFTDLPFNLCVKNDVFSLIGVPSSRVKHRFLPSCPDMSVHEWLVVDFKGRIATLKQSKMDKHGASLTMYLDFLELRRLGYTMRTIIRCWRMASQHKGSCAIFA